MRCSACAAARARGHFVLLALVLTTLGVAPLVWAGWTGTAPVVPGWWHVFGALGPTLAAWTIARREDGAEGVADWRERVLDWRIGAGWWLGAVAGPVLLLLAGQALASRFGGASGWGTDAPPPGVPAEGWATMVLVAVAYGVFEEPGWRGWLYPQLRMSHGPLAATLLLWPLWLAWHAPFFLYRMPTGAAAIGGFAIGLLAGAIVLSWLVEASGSAVPAVLFHVANNLAMQWALAAAPAALLPMNLLLLAVAAVVVVRWWLVPRRAAIDLADRARAFDGHPTAILR